MHHSPIFPENDENSVPHESLASLNTSVSFQNSSKWKKTKHVHKKTCKIKTNKQKKTAYENGKYVTVHAVQKVMSCMAFVFVFGVCAWDLYHVFPGLRLCSEFLDFGFSWIFW